MLRKALQNAVKKDILNSNPADKVDRPKKNVYQAQFYSAEEIMTLFDAVSDDPLEICVKLAAYYGLRRSEVLGLKWDAINLEQKTISIRHKVIEDEVDGKFVPVGEDLLKTKSSFRTLPLLTSVEKLLLAEKKKLEMYRRLLNVLTAGNISITFASTKPESSCAPIMSQSISAGCLKNSVSKRFVSTTSDIVAPACCWRMEYP